MTPLFIMSGKTNIQQKAEFLKLMEMSPVERGMNKLPVTPQEMATHLDVHVSTIYGWQKQFKDGDWFKQEKSDEEQKVEALYKLQEEVMTGTNVPANKWETFFKLKGWYEPKQEIRVGLSADEIARRNLLAERELRESGFGVEEVSEESGVLSKELRLDTGQSETGDN